MGPGPETAPWPGQMSVSRVCVGHVCKDMMCTAPVAWGTLGPEAQRLVLLPLSSSARQNLSLSSRAGRLDEGLRTCPWK